MSELKLNTRASIGAVTGPVGLLLGLIAVVISLSGIADASSSHGHKITARQLAPGAVTAKAIARGAVGPKALRKSAVNSRALADGAVNKRILAKESVIARALAPAAVGAAAIAPGAVYGGALASESIHVTPIADHDAVASNPEWTPSNTETALCAPGEALLGTGFMFTEAGNHEVGFLRAAPFLAAGGNGVTGEITSNSGGTAKAQIMAICLGG
ncbi:MAG: hypothetical protein U0R71_03770 [Solirubrobacterales bacterium]